MLPCSTAAVVPLAKTIFTAEGVAVGLAVAVTAGVDVRVGGSGVAVSNGTAGVGLDSGVAVAAGCMGMLQLANRNASMVSDISMSGFRKDLYGGLGFISNNLLMD